MNGARSLYIYLLETIADFLWRIILFFFLEFEYATNISNTSTVSWKFSNLTNVYNYNIRCFNIQWYSIFISFIEKKISNVR
jgi:hypothetical protein